MINKICEGKKMKDRNYVHKNMNEFNKSRVHKDKKNDYSRKKKHKERINNGY